MEKLFIFQDFDLQWFFSKIEINQCLEQSICDTFHVINFNILEGSDILINFLNVYFPQKEDKSLFSDFKILLNSFF